ncbi:SCO7613 C-terminal domain-containing membrane protein [Kribbella sp. NPDC055110]
MPTAAITCPTCRAPLHLTITPAPYPQPYPQPHRPLPAAPPHLGIHLPAPPPAPPVAPPVAPVAARPTRPPKPSRIRRLSPQATLLTLGVLLLLAAGVTFLAVNWDNLPVAAQAAIIGTLAALSFAGSIPASRHTLAGTAEALAILGTGLLTVDLYGARALGLIPPTAVDGLTYSAIVFTTIAVLALVMTRLAPKVVTYGVTTVIAAQIPVPLVLIDRASLPVLLGALLAQVVGTLFLSAKGTAIVRRTGSITATIVFCGILVAGMTRTLLGLVTTTTLSITIATAAVVCVAAATGIAILRKRPLPAALSPGLGECVCAAAAAFAVATTLPQLPGPSRWFTTALAAALAIVELVAARRTGKLAIILHTATITVAAVDLMYCVATDDIRQLGYLAAILAVLALFAAVRKLIDPVPTAAVASLSAQFAIVLFAFDGYVDTWPAAVALAVVAAIGIAVTCGYVGKPLEPVLLTTAACAAVLAEIAAVSASPFTATGVVLTIVAAPLIAYGMNPRRRPTLLQAALLLIIANTTFMLGADAHTLEWYTIPPALMLLTVGIVAWRNQSSWVYLGPGLLLGLAPSTLTADTTDNWLRATLVVAAAVLLILLAVRYSLQSPFIIGSAAVAKIGIAQFLEVSPLIPRWITLATAGLILLTTGATYERRLTQAKQATRWVANLH